MKIDPHFAMYSLISITSPILIISKTEVHSPLFHKSTTGQLFGHLLYIKVYSTKLSVFGLSSSSRFQQSYTIIVTMSLIQHIKELYRHWTMLSTVCMVNQLEATFIS